MVQEARASRGKGPAIAMAVLVHLALFTLLFFGVNWSNKEPPPVQVELWNNLPEQKVAEARPAPEQKPEPPLKAEEPKPAPVAKPEPAPAAEPEPAPLPKPDLALKEKQEKERKQKEQTEKEAKEKEAKEKEQKEKVRKEQEANQQKAKQQEAQAQKEKQEQEALAQKAQQEELARQQAEKTKADSERAAQKSLMDNYIAKIREKIRSNTDVPDGVPVGTRLVVKLVVLPTGEVLSMDPIGGSGNKIYNDVVMRGIKRAEPLPLPDDPKLRQQFRSFDLALTHEK